MKRLFEITQYGLGKLMPGLFGICYSWLVVYYYSVDLWGEYARISLVINIVLLIPRFGNFQYLMKKISTEPSELTLMWKQSFWSRMIFIIVLCLSIPLFPIGLLLKITVLVWIICSYFIQSCEVLIVFNKRFKLSLVTEFTCAMLFILLIVLMKEELTVVKLVAGFTSSLVLKAIFYLIAFKKYILSRIVSINLAYLKESLPFFLINFSGTFRTQIDTYMVLIFLDENSLGKYHIIVGLLKLAESGAAFILNPSIKYLYRLSRNKLSNIRKRVFYLGFLYAIITTLLIVLVITQYYIFVIPNWFYFLILIYSVPQLVKILLVNEFYAMNWQLTVTYLAVAFTVCQILIGWYSIPIFGISAAILLKSMAFIIHLIILYFIFNRRINKLSNGQ